MAPERTTGDDVRRWRRQLWQPRSAFTIGDLLNVARATDPYSRVERMYEWYFQRTMRTIRVAFTLAGSAALALLFHDEPSLVTNASLAIVIVVAVATGVAQMRLLSQLHRELAAALALLAKISTLVLCDDVRQPCLEQPDAKPPDATGAAAVEATEGLRYWRPVSAAVVALFVLTFALAYVHRAYPGGHHHDFAVVVAAAAVILLPGFHVAAESRRPGSLAAAEDRSLPLDLRIGDAQLDDYIYESGIRDKVDAALRTPREPRTPPDAG